MKPLVAWYAADQPSGVPVRSTAELDAVLDRVAELARPEWPVLVTLSTEGDLAGPGLYVGFHGEVGALLYLTAESGREFSRNASGADGVPLLYMYMTVAEEFPPDAEIHIDLVRSAAHHFAETRGKSPDVDWQAWAPADEPGSEWPDF